MLEAHDSDRLEDAMRMQAARTEIESGSLALVLRALGIEFGGPTWSSCCRALMLVLACALFNVIMFLVHVLGQSSSAWSSLLSVFTMDFIWVAGFVSYFSYRSGLRVALREMAVILFKYRRPVEEDCGWENEGQGEGASHELEERPGDEVDCADAFHRQSVAPLHAIDGASPSSPAAAAATAAAGSGSGSGSDGEGRAGRAPRCAADDGAAAADGLLDSLSRQALKGYPESMASLRRALADLHPRDTPSSALRVQRLRFAQGVAALAAALALFTAFEGLTLAFDFASFRAAELSTGIPAELLIAASILSYVFSVAAPLGSTVGAAALLGVLSSEPLRIRATLLAMSRVAPVDHHSLHHHHSGHGLDQAGVYGRLGAGPLLAAAATAVGRGNLPGLAAAGSGPGAGLVPQLVPLRRMPSGASMQGFLDDTASAQPRNPSRLGSTPPRPLDGYAAAELRRAAPVPVPRRNGGGAVALFDAQLARVRAQRRTASRISRQMGGPSALISVLMLAAGLLFLVLSQSMTGGSSVATIGFASLFFAVSQLPLLLFAMYTAALRKPLLVVASAPAGVLAQCAALRGPALSVLLSARLETDAVSLLGAVIDPASAIRLASLQVSLVVLAIQQMGGIRLSLDV
ncbi:hypothetical protein FNF29_03580 [Cafeteria roenbergensis]|uniref:Uncharacterized protein n=2 Tax=Cafeteria roenbergensis TaxID=33653 RepID=A0A5A8CLH7_CAFRO|nr:hypothetical protein FNF29_03580 [Cafeteria roenbergensis]|eukprot:KAA0152691.1 hypothetical protein FNF29_03580 [Cafeteria roenbergensis]